MSIIQVPSSKGDTTYEVDPEAKTCTCPDFTGRRAGTGQFCKHIRQVAPAKLKDLGWANGWPWDAEHSKYPEEVRKCDALGHKRTDVDKGPPNRGMNHVITCEACGIVYHVDSSD